MKNLLVGNGLNIQFDHTNYTTQQIVLRILKNCDRDDFPTHIIVDRPFLLKNYMGKLFLEAREIILGKYDSHVFGTAEKESLAAFKKQYSNRLERLRITDIGFEDYYLIHDLVCHKIKMQNPEQFYVREAMKVAYLYAIYNDGKLNQLHTNYPVNLNNYLNNFDRIFTTNYDSNIESATGKEVYHIHGQFDKKSDVYVESSSELIAAYDEALDDCFINWNRCQKTGIIIGVIVASLISLGFYLAKRGFESVRNSTLFGFSITIIILCFLNLLFVLAYLFPNMK